MRIAASICSAGLLLASLPASAQTPCPVPATAPLREQTAMPMTPKEHSDPSLMVAGQVIVGVAAATTVGGVILAVVPPHCSGFLCGLDRVAGGGGMVLGGMLLGGLGAAFWAAGGASPGPGKRDAVWLRPRVAVGPGSAMVTWSF